ncbi:hypothetical protein Tco_0156634 [Tanacetum coccineum]
MASRWSSAGDESVHGRGDARRGVSVVNVISDTRGGGGVGRFVMGFSEVVPKSVAGSSFPAASSMLLPFDVQVQQDF